MNRLLAITSVLAATVAIPLAHAAPGDRAQAVLEGEGIEGTATFEETPSGVLLITIEATGVPEGPHGIHIHEMGMCDVEGGHESAGGHMAGEHVHGIMNENGPHPGDLPNAHVQADGILHVEFFSTMLSLDSEGEGALMGENGASIVLHADADDYTTDPAGNSGDRIACGVIDAAT
jgi:superoxide dismutase, Cu-Zn family